MTRDTVNHLLLSENIRLNELDSQVRVFQGCAWDSTGSIKLTQQHDGNMGSFHAEDSNAPGSIAARTLDDLVADSPVGMIKIDVEGGELRVLRGASLTLERCHPILFIEAHGPAARRGILGFLGPLGYLPIQVAGLSETYLFAHPRSPLLMPVEGLCDFAWLLHQRQSQR